MNGISSDFLNSFSNSPVKGFTEEKPQRMCFASDGAGNNYLLPVEALEQFNEDCAALDEIASKEEDDTESSEENEDDDAQTEELFNKFESDFSQYSIDGISGNYSFTDVQVIE